MHNAATGLANSALSARGRARQRALRAAHRTRRTLDRRSRSPPFLRHLVSRLLARAARRDVRGSALSLDHCGQLPDGRARASGSAHRGDAPRGHRRRIPHPRLLHRVHARGSRRCALLHLSESVRLLHAHLGDGRRLPPPLRGLGGGGPLLLSPHRVLVSEAVGHRRGQEGLHRQPRGRLRLRPRRHAHLDDLRHADLPRRLQQGHRRGEHGHLSRHCSPPLHWRLRQVRPAPALHLAARRHGGPHARVRPHPRRHHGDGGRVHGGALPQALRDGASLPGDRGVGRRPHRALRGHHRRGSDRHQARARLLHHQPARLHVRGRGRGRVRRGHLPSRDPRLLQGPSLPWRGQRHPRSPRRAGPAQDGRHRPAHARHHHHLPGGRRGSGRSSTVRGLLLQGRDPRRHLPPRGPSATLVHPPRGRVPHRAIHLASRAPRLLRTAAHVEGASAPHPRVARGDDHSPRRAGHPHGGGGHHRRPLRARHGVHPLSRPRGTLDGGGARRRGRPRPRRRVGDRGPRRRIRGLARVRTRTGRRGADRGGAEPDPSARAEQVLRGRALRRPLREAAPSPLPVVRADLRRQGDRRARQRRGPCRHRVGPVAAPPPDRLRHELRARHAAGRRRARRVPPRGPSVSAVLSTVTFLPVLGALVVFVLPRRSEGLVKATALVTSLIAFAASVPLYARFDAGTAEYQFVEQRAWMPAFGISYHLGVDGISLLLVLLTTFLMPLTLLASWHSVERRWKEFAITMLLLETGMLGVFVALDLFLFYIFWEAMLIPMYLVIGIWGGPNRVYAAVKFVLYTLVGSLLMLVAILALYFQHGAATGVFTYDLPVIARWVVPGGRGQSLLFLTWLPDAHVEAPTPGSVILAGVLLKMGTYGFLRFYLPLFPQAALAFAPWMFALAVIGILYGAWVSTVQPDIKKLVAYSSVSHLGFVVLGLFTLNQQGMVGSIIQMVNHGLSTGALFLIVGMLYERRHTRLIVDFGGLWKIVPALSVLFLVVTFSSIGLPGLNGFVGEFLILVGAFQVSRPLAVIATTGIIFAAVYMLWMYQRVIFGEVTRDENRRLSDLSAREWVILVPVLAFIFWIGIYPVSFTGKTETSVRALITQVQTKAAATVALASP